MRTGNRNRLWAMAALAVVLFVALASMPVAADINPWTVGGINSDTCVPPANFALYGYTNGNCDPTQYYFNLTNASGSLNAIHITNDITNQNGGVYTTTASSGTFYVSDTGGRGGEDDIILLAAINRY